MLKYIFFLLAHPAVSVRITFCACWGVEVEPPPPVLGVLFYTEFAFCCSVQAGVSAGWDGGQGGPGQAGAGVRAVPWHCSGRKHQDWFFFFFSKWANKIWIFLIGSLQSRQHRERRFLKFSNFHFSCLRPWKTWRNISRQIDKNKFFFHCGFHDSLTLRHDMTPSSLKICWNILRHCNFLKGSVSRDFRPPVFFMIQTHLGPW